MLLFSMPGGIGGSTGVSDELKNLFRRANASPKDLFRKNSIYSKNVDIMSPLKVDTDDCCHFVFVFMSQVIMQGF